MKEYTFYIALFGAITGAAALFWDIVKWIRIGPKIRYRISYSGKLKKDVLDLVQSELSIDITNNGDVGTTLNAVRLAFFEKSIIPNKNAVGFIEPRGNASKIKLPTYLESNQTWSTFVTRECSSVIFDKNNDKSHFEKFIRERREYEFDEMIKKWKMVLVIGMSHKSKSIKHRIKKL